MSSTFNRIYENSIKNPEKFWQEASEDIFGLKTIKILNKSNPPFYKWFKDELQTHTITLYTFILIKEEDKNSINL